MRFLSSSAFPSAEKLRFAASCSAAETMFGFLPRPSRRHAPGQRDIQQTPDIIWCSASISPSSCHADCPPGRAMTQMLRRLTFVLLCRRQDFHRAARLLDRRDGGFRGAVNLDIQLGLDFTTAEQPHAILGTSDNAGFHQRLGIDGAAGIERLGVDRPLDAIEVDLGEFEPEDIVEATLRQPPMQRHLTAFEALDPHARARGLALAAPARGLALAGADATADAHALLARAGIVGDIAELHRSLPLSPEHDPDRKPVPAFRDHAPTLFLSTLADDADEMLNFCDHAASRGGVLQLGSAADLV